MEGSRLGTAYAQAETLAGGPSQVPLLVQLGNRLSEANKALDQQGDRLAALAQRLFGPVPSEVRKDAESPHPNHATGTLQTLANELEKRIGAIESSLRRLEQL
jgi:hypothetical protein